MSIDDFVGSIAALIVLPTMGWMLKLEGKTTALRSDFDGSRNLIEVRLNSNAERFEQFEKANSATLERIEKNLDHRLERIERSLNGHLVKD